MVPVGEDDPLAVVVAGSAVAVGEETFASARLTCHVVDRGRFSFAHGEADFTARARGRPGEAPLATAEARVDIGGADLVRSTTTVTRSSRENADGSSTTMERTQTGFVALDLEGLDFERGPRHRHVDREMSEPGPGTQPAGNVATFQTAVTATGADSFATTDVVPLTVENRLSSVDIAAAAAVGSPPPGQTLIGTRGADTLLSGPEDALVMAGRGRDTITTQGGSDLIFAGDGSDVVDAGDGNNTVLAGDGADRVKAGSGNDWLFGGNGDDRLEAGNGNNVVHGGEGRDTILTGDGADTIRGGRGNDTITAGGGSDTLLLGGEGCGGDGDDRYTGGAGCDLYVIDGPFGRDVIADFRLADGDRLVLDGVDLSLANLARLNGDDVMLRRGGSGGNDLVLTFDEAFGCSTLTLTGFFGHHAEHAGARRGVLSDAAAVPILEDLLVSRADLPDLDTGSVAFAVGDMLSLLG
jgi:hypothetical protein